MGMRAKTTRSATNRRGRVAAAGRTRRVTTGRTTRAERGRRASAAARARARKTSPNVEVKPSSNGLSGFVKALRFLQTLSDFERLRIVRYNSTNFDLDRMRTLLKKLGNPQDTFRSIHIAGTKGKGSTCAMTEAMLRANGYKTGLYTSPHLVDIRERICTAGEMIPQADF